MERAPSFVDPPAAFANSFFSGVSKGPSSVGMSDDTPPPVLDGNPPQGDPSARVLLVEMSAPQDVRDVSATPVPKPDVMQVQEGNELYDSDDSIGSPLKGIFEVDTLLEMRKTAAGKREFLIKWRGWGPSWNNWEPEEHILDRRLLRKFDKKREVKVASSQDVDDFTMRSKRRCAKQAAVKARATARKEHENLGEEKSDD